MFSLFKKHRAEETAIVEEKIKDAFPKEKSLADDAQDRVFKKIMTARGALESNIPTTTQNRPVKPGKVLTATGLVAVLAILVLFSSKTYLPLKVFNTEKALAAIEKPGMITYYKVTGNYKGDDSGRWPSWQAEYWVDYEKRMLKRIHLSYSKTGDLETTSYMLIRDGRAIDMTMRDGEIDHVFESDEQGSFDNDLIAGGFRKYRELLKSGNAEVLGEEEIKGITTYKIKARSATKADTTEIEVANIRKDNYKPVKITFEERKERRGEESELSAETTIYIDETRLIDPEDLGENVFELDIPEDANYLTSRNLSIEQARQFKEFDLYYLGNSFDGFEFAEDIHFSKRVGGPDSPGDPRHTVYIAYRDLEKPGGVGIFISPIMEPDIENWALIQDDERTNITINGNPAVLTVQQGLDYSVCRLYINIGRSTVNIASHGKDEAKEKDRIIRAAESLIKIN